MAKVKYDVSNAEVRTFEVPKPGVYPAKIHEMTYGKSSNGNDMFTIVFEIASGDFKGSRVWYYILNDGSQEWRMREFTDACGLKPKGALDTDELVGTAVNIKTAIEPAKDGYDEKARIKNVLPAKGAEAADDEDEAPYEEWEIADLREEVEARELEVEGKKTKKKLIAALEADDAEDGDEDEEDEDEEEEAPKSKRGAKSKAKDEEEDEEDEEDEEEEEDEDELSMSDLQEMDRAELKKLIAEEELDIKVTKKTTEDQLRTKIAEALELEEDEDEGEEEDDDDEEAEDYSEWDIADLKKELKERGLKTDGRKSVLVKRLEKDDESSDDEPF